jgi:hypothetical protein
MKIESKVTKTEKIMLTLDRVELCVAHDMFHRLIESLKIGKPTEFTKMEHGIMHMFYKNLEKIRFKLNEQETDNENKS